MEQLKVRFTAYRPHHGPWFMADRCANVTQCMTLKLLRKWESIAHNNFVLEMVRIWMVLNSPYVTCHYGLADSVHVCTFLGFEFDSPLSICFEIIWERYGKVYLYPGFQFVIVQIQTSEIKAALNLSHAVAESRSVDIKEGKRRRRDSCVSEWAILHIWW